MQPHKHSLAVSQFRPTPWRKHWQAGDGSVGVELFGLDSSSGLAGHRFNYFQSGNISAQEFRELEALLRQPRPARCARAFVCHHSPSYRTNWRGTVELDAPSIARLRQLAQAHGVDAILTGHTHDFYFGNLNAGNARRRWHELRCASSVAAGQTLNGFLLHGLSAGRDGRWHWQVWRCAWDGHRFQQDRQPAATLDG